MPLAMHPHRLPFPTPTMVPRSLFCPQNITRGSSWGQHLSFLVMLNLLFRLQRTCQVYSP